MNIKALGEKASTLGQEAPEDWALAAAAVGEALEVELADPQVLVTTSMRIAGVAQLTGCSALVGASHLGDRLAAAAVALAQNGIHMRRPGELEPALIVDGLLATGAGVSSAASRLKKEGVVRAVAAVVISAGGAELAPEVDQLVILES